MHIDRFLLLSKDEVVCTLVCSGLVQNHLNYSRYIHVFL